MSTDNDYMESMLDNIEMEGFYNWIRNDKDRLKEFVSDLFNFQDFDLTVSNALKKWLESYYEEVSYLIGAERSKMRNIRGE